MGNSASNSTRLIDSTQHQAIVTHHPDGSKTIQLGRPLMQPQLSTDRHILPCLDAKQILLEINGVRMVPALFPLAVASVVVRIGVKPVPEPVLLLLAG